jgi:hypothetical protein
VPEDQVAKPQTDGERQAVREERLVEPAADAEAEAVPEDQMAGPALDAQPIAVPEEQLAEQAPDAQRGTPPEEDRAEPAVDEPLDAAPAPEIGADEAAPLTPSPALDFSLSIAFEEPSIIFAHVGRVTDPIDDSTLLAQIIEIRESVVTNRSDAPVRLALSRNA